MSIEQLIKWALKHRQKTLGLTDINSTAGNLEFVRQAQKAGIRPILGIDFRNGAQQQYIGIARNNDGYQTLCQWLSEHLHHNLPFENEAPQLAHCHIIYPLHNLPTRPLLAHEWIGIRPHEVNRARFMKQLTQQKLVAFPCYTLPRKEDFELHCVLRAIDQNTLISKLTSEDTGDPQDVFLPKSQLLHAYEMLPACIDNLKHIVVGSSIEFVFSPKAKPQNIKTWTGDETQDYEKVKQLCKEGLAYRYDQGVSRSILRRVITELNVIRKMQFLSYFLTSWDIVRYARSKNYYYVGRGSGANSVVAYLLRITDVDPIELDLYFERFINLFRTSPPDFDIDFSSRERDDVTRYIFERYPNAVLLATHSTFQQRAVLREVGKAVGMPPHEIDKLQSAHDNQNLDKQEQLIMHYSMRLSGFPSHLSVHAGGILISEKPIHYFTATSLPPKGFPITHFDMIIAEDVGLYKYDLLAQRGLGKIKDALTIIAENRPERLNIDIHNVKLFTEDPLVKINLREAKAIGCFYVESPAMRMLLTKLQAEDYLTLVAASSIIRPGVAQSGMMREYILRYRIPERREEAHPVLRGIMPDTFGVMVYQEDVIKVAHYFAGLSLAEADVLRRGMSGKYRSREEFQQVKDKFFANCQQKGYQLAVTEDVWRQIESFAGYAFAKGHSASYAIESYQSLFLKSHYPLEFMVAVINNGGGFYSREFYLHEARMHGAQIELPCINTSEPYTIIRDKTIYLGIGMIKDLNEQTIRDIMTQRHQNGAYRSVDDLVRRVSVSLEQLALLIRMEAFRFTQKSKKALLWHAHFLLGNTGKSQTTPSLFEPTVKKYQLPIMDHHYIEDIYDQMELLGFPLIPPYSLLKNHPKDCMPASEFHRHINKKVRTLGYLITTKRVTTARKDKMYFGNFLDEEGNFIDTVHFPPVAKRYPFNGQGIYVMEGRVMEEFGAITLEVTRMQRLPYMTMEV